MKNFIKFALVFLVCFIAFAIFMNIKTERDYDTRYKQIIHGDKKGKDMQYCNTRASIGIEDYTSCMHRMSEANN